MPSIAFVGNVSNKQSTNTKLNPPNAWTKAQSDAVRARVPMVFSVTRPLGDGDGGTCAPQCPLLTICYASSGRVNLQQRKSADVSFIPADEVRRIGAVADKAGRRAAARWHVAGDVYKDGTPDRDYVGALVGAHEDNAHVVGWSYTHGADDYAPGDFRTSHGNFCMNASCDTQDQLRANLARGWDCVTIVAHDHDAAPVDCGEYVLRVCPEQARGVACARCMLCARVGRRVNGKPLVIGFRAHDRIDAVEAAVVRPMPV